MPPLRRLSAAEQVAEHLRDELDRGRWHGTMPGVIQLAAELAASRKTLEAALHQLEAEGRLAAHGPGRKRSIMFPGKAVLARQALHIGILLHESFLDRDRHILELQHALEAAGHSILFARKSQSELKSDLRRIRDDVGKIPADAWVVVAGSRPVLEWFAAQTTPSLALFGRRLGLPIAASGPDKVPAYAAATRELIRLGHRRIVLLCRRLRRLPEPGRIESAFLAELAAAGIRVSDYNLPDWDETIAGFHARLVSLFKLSPPTALIVDEPPLFAATQQFLAERNLRVPAHVSLVCTDADTSFLWCHTPISHIGWDSRPVIRRVVRWAAAVSKGRTDLRQTLFPAHFVRGGSIGPVPLGERLKS